MKLFRRSYNAPGQRHADVAVPLRGEVAPLRYPDGTPTGFEVRADLRFRDRRWPDGTVRLDYHEVVPSPVGDLVFHLGGNGYEDAQNVKYGHLSLTDIDAPPGRPVPAGGGRGRPAPAIDGPDGALAVAVRSIPLDMHYKRPQDTRSGSNRGARFMHYGDPASDQGERHDVHYTYLLWSCPNVAGGGMVRALLADGTPVRRCDVDPVIMPSYDETGDRNGSVEMVYVQVAVDGGADLYGWTASAHELAAEPPVAHLAPGR